MPSEGIDLTPNQKLLSSEEILRVARLFVSQGVTKIRLTGGEPTVRKDCVELIEELGKLRPMGLKEIAMTSNGIALWRKLDRMVAGGLTHLNLSLDTLDPFKYQIITRRMGILMVSWLIVGLEMVLKTIDRALELGISPVKLNCVVIKNLNDIEVLDFVEMTRDKPIEVRFIEFMPFDGTM
jgi:GTP 3',8-cyclase